MMNVSIRKKIKTYKGISQLNVETVFPELSVTRIQGASGSGKTTFLKIIAGLITPDYGIIHTDQACWLDTAQQINWTPQRRKVGFVFQDFALFPNMTVMEHLKYATDDQLLTERLLHLGKMDSFSDHRPRHLSGGQQQRVAILRALALKPGLLLMDEAFSALDDELRETLLPELRVLLTEFKTTTIIVSHHSQETAGFADRSLKIELE